MESRFVCRLWRPTMLVASYAKMQPNWKTDLYGVFDDQLCWLHLTLRCNQTGKQICNCMAFLKANYVGCNQTLHRTVCCASPTGDTHRGPDTETRRLQAIVGWCLRRRECAPQDLLRPAVRSAGQLIRTTMRAAYQCAASARITCPKHLTARCAARRQRATRMT